MQYELKLDEAEVNLIGEALGAQPYKLVAALLAKISGQVQQQQAKPQLEAVKDSA